MTDRQRAGRSSATRLTVTGVLALVMVLAGCGGGELSMSEYIDELNLIMDSAQQEYEVVLATPQFAVLEARGEGLAEFTPGDLEAGLERVGEIELRVLAAVEELEPPEELEALHELMFDDRFTIAREALTERAATAKTWEELSATPEMAAYRNAVARDLEVCLEIQSELDATAARGVFADIPWIPGDLKEVVDAVVGCGSWPDDPQEMYRP